MPPTTTFVRLNKRSTVPLRIHVNRKKLILSSIFDSTIGLSQRAKAIVTLKKINFIRLSNKDINALTQSTEEEILNVLLNSPINSLIQESSSKDVANIPSTSVCIDLNKSKWKAHLVVSIKFLILLRVSIGVRLSLEDNIIAEKYLGVKNSGGTLRLVTKQSYVNPVVLVEDEEESLLKENQKDNKKTNMSIKYTSEYLLDDIGGPIDLYVYERPQS